MSTQSTPTPDGVTSQRPPFPRVLAALGVLLVIVLAAIVAVLNGAPAASSPSAATATPVASSAPSLPTTTTTSVPTTIPADPTAPAAEDPAPSGAAPTDAGPAFTEFAPSTGSSAGCIDDVDSPSIVFTWSSTGAHTAWIGIATQNAMEAPYSAAPVNGSIELAFQCANESELYTVTLLGDHGVEHHSVTVTR